jgi:hypothetical protein
VSFVAAAQMRFRRAFYDLLPSQFRDEPDADGNGGEGELVAYSLTVMMDAYQERARLAWLARFPTHAPPDALPLLGRDRKVVRGFSEPEATYRSRLVSAPTRHRTRGNAFALMAELRAYCGVDMMIRTVDNRGTWYTRAADGTQSTVLAAGNFDWDGEPTKWSRFFVVLYPPTTLWTEGPVWGDADLWGGAWGTSGYTWGSTATPEQVRSIRGIIRDWKPAGTRCVNIIVAFDAASFDPATAPGAPMPDGGWAFHGDGASTRGRSRLDTARYWKGTS